MRSGGRRRLTALALMSAAPGVRQARTRLTTSDRAIVRQQNNGRIADSPS
jgi:hypothetical protein